MTGVRGRLVALAVLAAVVGATAAVQGAAAAPSNDSFSAAVPLSGPTTSATGTNVAATREAGEPMHGGVSIETGSVWWRWTASQSGTVRVDTIGSDFDTVLGVYTGTSVSALTTIAANDNGLGTYQSEVSFSATAGTTYSIAVAGFNSSTGNIRLSINPPRPTNDDFANAQALAGATGSLGATTDRATGEPGEPAHWGGGPYHSLWYSWTGDVASRISFATSAPVGASPAVVVYTGASLGALTRVAAGGAGASFTPTPGTRYWIALDNFSSGPFTLTWSRPGPTNDDYDTSTFELLRGASGSVDSNNFFATKQPGEPAHAGNAGGASVWYLWTPGANGRVRISTAGSGFDTLLAVYTGSSLTTLTPLAANDDAAGGTTTSTVTFDVNGGPNAAYWIAVDGKNGATGTLRLTWAAVPPANDDLVDAAPLTGTAGGTSANLLGATVEPDEPTGMYEGPTVWWSWTPATSGIAVFDTIGSPGDSTLRIFRGTSIATLVGVAEDRDSATGSDASATFVFRAGTRYLIQAATWDGGSVNLNWRVDSPLAPTPPANDDFAAAAPLAGEIGHVAGTVLGASNEAGEPRQREGGASVWYRWTAPESGLVFFSLPTIEGTWPAVVDVFAGGAIDALAQLDAGDVYGPGAVFAVAGRTYSLRVRSANGFGRSFVLDWNREQPAPPNDDFSAAQLLAGPAGSVPTTTYNASFEAGEPDHGVYGPSVWYRWTAPATGTYRFDAGAGSGAIDIFTGDSVRALTRKTVAYGEPATLAGDAGVTYSIAVVGGPFHATLTWSAGAGSVPNDEFAAATPLTGDHGTLSGTNAGATSEGGEPAATQWASVWFRFTVPATGTYAFDTFGSSFDTVVGAYAGNAVDSLTSLAFSDDAGGTTTSLVSVGAQAGTTLWVAVASNGQFAGRGDWTLNWKRAFTTPPNDMFASPTSLTGAAGSVNASNVGASKETGEPAHGGAPGGASVWFTWTAPQSGPFLFRATNPALATQLGVYTGTAVSALTPVAPTEGPPGASTVRVDAVAGTTYRVAVDGWYDDGTTRRVDTGSFALTWGPRPANDDWASARVLDASGGAVAGTLVGATLEPAEPPTDGFGGSVWFALTPATSGVYAVSVDAGGSTSLDVWTGSALASLTRVAAHDGYGPPALSLPARDGTTYYIRVALEYGDAQPFTLRWSRGGPDNDAFASAAPLSALLENGAWTRAVSVGGANTGATREAGEPLHAGQPGGASVWWTFTAPVAGYVSVDTVGSTFDTLLGVYTGSGVSALTQIGGDHDAAGGGASRVVFWSPANAVYRIAVDGKSGATGVVRLRVQPVNPANDAFATPQTIAGASGALTANNNGATKEPGEPDTAGDPGGHSLWYRWTAPATGTYEFDVAADDFGALIGIYTGSSVGALTPVASAAGDDFGGATAGLGATAGTTYMIAIDGSVFGAQTGQIRLSWRPDAAATSNDMFAGATELTGWSGSVSGTNEAATSEAGERAIGSGRTLWFRWTAPADGAVAFDVQHPFDGVAVDPVGALYVGPSVGALVRVSDVSPAVHQRVAGGTTYWLQLDTIEEPGAFRLDWLQLSPPVNDDYASAVALAGDRLSVVGTLADATRERGEPAHGVSPTATVSVWYRWTAPRSGRVTIDLRPGSLDDPDANALVSVYTGGSLATLARVTGSEEWWGREVAARLHFDAVGGTTYSLAVTRWPGSSVQDARFRLNLSLPPGNDAFAAAEAIAGPNGTVAGRNSGATKEPGEPDHSGNRGGASIWYRWTAPASGMVVFDTRGSVPDTLLAAYTGPSVSSLTEVARDDQAGGGNDARLVFDVTAGATYSLALDGFYGPYLLEPYDDTDTGDTVLTWRMAPANDAFAAAERLADRSGRIAGSTVGASKEPGEPAHAQDAGGHSIWYVWTAGADGDVDVDTSGSSFDTLLGVYRGGAVGALAAVATSDDADGLLTSHARFHATAGTTYMFAVDGKGGATGRLFLQWRLEGAPSNDDLVDALPLAGTKGNVLVDNTWATTEPSEPAHAGVTGGASVWYRWTAPVTARVTFETERDYSPDTALAIYTGTGYGSLTQVAASDDRSDGDPSSIAGFAAVAGTTYLIAVDTRNGVYGTFQLWWNRPPDNDDRLITRPLSGSSGSYAQTNAWATTQLGEGPIAGVTGGASVWFAWTAPASGTVTFDTAGSDFDTLLGLYRDDYYDWTQLAGDDDSAGGGASRLSYPVTAGQSYEIVVDGKNGAMGTLQLHWSLPVPAPANDAFPSPAVLSGGSASSSSACSPCTTVGATAEAGEPAHDGGGHSVWFRWTAPASGPVLLTATTGDWALWPSADVYTGGSVGALTSVARAPAAGYESETIWNAIAGTTYSIALDTRGETARDDDAGVVALSLAQTGAAPANDGFASAQAIAGDSGSVTGTSANASPQAGEPPIGGGRTVWYRWTPATGGRVTLTPSASGSFYYDFPRVAVYTGASLTALTRVPVELAPNPNWPQPAPFRFRVDPGVTYYLQVDGSNPTPGAPEAGPFTLQWSTLAGDYFSGPVRLAGAAGTARANTTLATKEAGEPAHARNVGGHSLWFAWTPAVSGDVTLDTAGTAFDSLLAVYTGSTLATLTEVASNDDAPGSATSALTFAAVAGTTYRIAVDGYSGAAGDLTLAWSTAGVATDATPPSVALTAPAAGAFVGRQVTVAADATDDVAVAQVEFFADGVSLGADTTAPYSVLWTTSTHADGAATLTARATDSAGNVTTSVARTITVDNTSPTATITGRPTSPNSAATSTFTFTSNEVGVTFQCRLDTDAWTSCASPVNYTLPAGDHWFYVQAVDRAGNLGAYDSANWTQIGPPPNDPFANAQVLAAASGSVSGTTQNATKEAGEPNHAGNAGGHSIWYRWTAQAGGTVTVSTAGSSFDTLLAVYTGTTVGALAAVASNDDVSAKDRTSRVTFTAVSGTTYRIAVDGFRAAFGPVTLNWSGPAPVVDTTPPDTTITSGPGGTTSATSATFAFTASETGSTFQCRVDAAAWSSCATPSTVGVAAGTHTFDVRAIDVAGNVDATPATRSWTVDTTAPDTTISGGPSGTVTDTTASFTFSATETATFECRLDGAAWSSCTSPKGYTALASGAHTFDVRATDAAGNADATPASRTWTIQAPASPPPPPPSSSNDAFANATTLSGASGSTTATTVGMTKEPGEPSHAGNAGGHSIWFAWTAPATGSVTIDTAGSTFDTLLAAYTGTAVGSLTTVASNDDANGTTQSSITFAATVATTYRIAVDGYAGAAGSVTLHWAQGGAAPTGPANDAFASAASLAGTASGTTVGATKEPGEPNHAGIAGGHSIWWTWTATASGSATITTASSSFDTLLAVYTGTALSALTAVASNDDANGTTQSQVVFTAAAGTTYRVAVDGYGGTSGSVSIRVSQP